VAKLLALARPTRAYFGRKDAQQVAVIRRMITDLGFPTVLRECGTVRAADGLALSSRNAYLSPAARQTATALFAALARAKREFERGERRPQALLAAARAELERAGPALELEYLELRREGDLAELPAGPALDPRLLIAARVGGVRLIDNLALARAEA
jgi:pantoate--beta-alanine ligase